MAIDPPVPGKGAPSAKRARPTDAANLGNRTTAPEEDQSIEQPIGNAKGSVSITLPDLDLLHCPICSEPLSSPVYQCQNGHIACASCCNITMKNKYSNCSLQIGSIRCRVIEKIVESAIIGCQYMPYGCKEEMLSYSRKVGHEKACTYVPCSCPCCDFVGNSKCLYDHFGLKHEGSSRHFNNDYKAFISMDTTQKHVILRGETEGVLFIVNRCIETLGEFFNVVCVAPPASGKRFVCELKASIGEHLIKVTTPVEMMSKWTTQPSTKMSFMVPTHLISTDQIFTLYISLWNKSKNAEFTNRLRNPQIYVDIKTPLSVSK